MIIYVRWFFLTFLPLLNWLSTFYINGPRLKKTFLYPRLPFPSAWERCQESVSSAPEPLLAYLPRQQAMPCGWHRRTPVGLSQTELHVASGPRTWTCAESPGGLINAPISGSTPRVSDSASLGWHLRICFSKKFQNETDAAGPTWEPVNWTEFQTGESFASRRWWQDCPQILIYFFGSERWILK